MQRRSALDGEGKVRGPGPPDTHFGALADVCFGEIYQEPHFGVLKCGHTAENDVWGTRDEAWVC
jgi:hypothetical protein